MKKLTKKEISKIKKQLKPFWDEHINARAKYFDKLEKIEKEMNKKLNLNIDLEFFHVDGEIVGIGAQRFENRKFFPLI